ncbi:hypothetical protein [Pseudobutyrivibrio xylanivorans]|uniref:Uncharacterized protein n=1 Tax=Pseudobutyrivibrio xylanivorans DSM 14809 TaxID=1123012 RepID=A0A1M6H0U8_PSEXY|nr:hypothetical protein [Pseudobutyrivibrio xylanivorans]SHJ15818.1 hypothetical protein SAMN02745725_01900 [Pseudobutyrivibrio xylanivorans DSM 14809]
MEYVDKEQEQVTKTLKGEKKKLSQMSFGQKLEYIWEYYKLHILVTLLIIGAITWGVHHALTYVQYKFYGMVINSSQYDEKVAKEMHDVLKMEKHDGFSLSGDFYTYDDVNMGGYGNKLDIYIMTGQLDFAFTDEVGVKYLVDMGVVRDLKTTAPDKLLDLWTSEGRLYNVDVTDDDGITGNYDVAVDITGTGIQEYFGLDEKMKYLMIADLSGSEEYLQNFYDLIYKIEKGE